MATETVAPESPEIVFEGDALTTAQREEFTGDAKIVFDVLERIRERASIPATQIKLVVASELTTSVRAHQKEAEGLFEPERPYGRVSAKNLPQDEAGHSVVIVFDSREWAARESGHARWTSIGLLAHELAHPILTRVRRESGVLDGVIYPSHTPTEIASSLSRIAFDEYRADAMADEILANTATMSRNGVLSPARTWDVAGQDYINGVRDFFAGLHPQLPDVVQTYRERRLDLVSMWHEVVRQSEGIVTAFMHARAHADGAADDIAILDADEIRDLPFVQLYLADTIPPYLEAVRKGALLIPIADYAAADAEVIGVGGRMLREIWRRLGLTFTENTSSREFAIHVVAPLR